MMKHWLLILGFIALPGVADEPSFVVAPNGKEITQPAWPVHEGQRWVEWAGRVVVGSPCDCKSLVLSELDGLYCAIDDTKRRVARCVRNR